MQDSNEDAQQPRGASCVLVPLVGERLAAMGGGEDPWSLAAAQNVEAGGGGHPRTGISRRGGDLHALTPASRLAPIVAAPAVTDEQRQRLRRAIDAYRAEA